MCVYIYLLYILYTQIKAYLHDYSPNNPNVTKNTIVGPSTL